MKHSITRLYTILIAILFVSALGYGQNTSSTAKLTIEPPKADAKPVAKNVTVPMIQSDIREALAVIENNHVGGKKLDYNEVFKSSIDTMLHALDPHSNYFDAKEFEQFNTDQSSRYYGIGATIGDLSDANGKVVATYIKATFEGAPAHKAGLRYGDKIVEVNGTSMLGKPFNEVRSFLRGPQGTNAKIVVERLATGKRETVQIVRDAVPQPSISEWYMIRPGVGYMAMNGGFNRTTYGEFVQAMTDLKAAGMQQLVIDLRDNGGGLVSHAYRIANAFLRDGQTVFTQKGRIEGVSERYPAQNRNPDQSPLIILVNRNSASASEILAGALQDHDRALIVGENTFGKGLVQNPFMLDHGSMLLLTIAKYETPSGRLIQRDYSNGELYNYYTNGGIGNENEDSRPKGAESKTDTGRTVYSGGGINPDVVVKPDYITIEVDRVQRKIANAIFSYSLNLTAGKVKGWEQFKKDQPIVFNYDLRPTDFEITTDLFSAFKRYSTEKFAISPALIDREQDFVKRILRTELVTASFGSQTSFQVGREYDKQVLKAIDLLPQAKQLAMSGAKSKNESSPRKSPQD